jgi:hypothetical protein
VEILDRKPSSNWSLLRKRGRMPAGEGLAYSKIRLRQGHATAGGGLFMPMRRPLVFERERSALLAIIVEDAYEECCKRGLFLSANGQEARMILVRRVIAAIEAGENDPDKLRVAALQRADAARH